MEINEGILEDEHLADGDSLHVDASVVDELLRRR